MNIQNLNPIEQKQLQEIGYTVATGGFQATAYTDDDVTEVVLLDLKFILAEWDAEIEEK
jgi:hypothetical protein